MPCDSIKFSAHGLIKLTVRDIDAEDVIDVVRHGVVVFEYPKDRPYPSRLVLGWVGDIETNNCIVVTAYWPDDTIWLADFKTKK